MVPLSLMKALFATTDERYRSPLVQPILERWEHDPGSDSGVSASSNFVLFFTAGGVRRVLRFSVDDTGPFQRHSLLHIQAELEFLRWLGEKGLHVNQPVPSKAGRWVEAVVTPLGVVRAVVFEVLEGELSDFDEMPASRYPSFGEAVAAYHNAAQCYDRPGRPSWHDHLAQARTMTAPENTLVCGVIEKLTSALESLPVTRRSYGLIHYDLCADNLFWDPEGRPGYIDFDDCSYDWFAADLAYAIRDLVGDRASRFDPADPSFQAILEGYRRARPFSDEEVATIPLFLMKSHLLNYLELKPQVDAREDDDPDWIRSIKARLGRKTAAYAEEFERFLAA